MYLCYWHETILRKVQETDIKNLRRFCTPFQEHHPEVPIFLRILRRPLQEFHPSPPDPIFCSIRHIAEGKDQQPMMNRINKR